MSDIEKSQKVWVCFNRFKTSKIEETTIKTVGKKYITVEADSRMKFHKDTLREVDYVGCASFIILDLKEYEKDKYYRDLINNLERFKWEKLSREDLGKIAQILNLNDK